MLEHRHLLTHQFLLYQMSLNQLSPKFYSLSLELNNNHMSIDKVLFLHCLMFSKVAYIRLHYLCEGSFYARYSMAPPMQHHRKQTCLYSYYIMRLKCRILQRSHFAGKGYCKSAKNSQTKLKGNTYNYKDIKGGLSVNLLNFFLFFKTFLL